MSNWHKDGPYWRHSESSNAGDLIFNTCYKIIQDADISEWSFIALIACGNLLEIRQRWPLRLDEPDTSKTWIQWKWYKWGFGKKVYSRPRHVMTRDPYIAWTTACIFTNNKHLIRRAPMPWYLYSPEIWRWRRRLIKDKRIDYKRRLGWLRARAVVMDQSEFN